VVREAENAPIRVFWQGCELEETEIEIDRLSESADLALLKLQNVPSEMLIAPLSEDARSLSVSSLGGKPRTLGEA